MNKNIFLFLILLILVPGSVLCSDPELLIQQNPAKGNQILYKGKEWHNLYASIKGDQFLFARDYLPGSVTVDGKTFNNIDLSFDIYNDEIITPANQGIILQLNKEMIDSFSFTFQLRKYDFINMREDGQSGINGYVNSLYKGKSALVVKYKKEIDLLAVDDKYDLFFQTYRVYILKNGIARQVSGKNDLLKVLEDNKDQVKAFIKKNMLKVTKKNTRKLYPCAQVL